MRLQKGVALGNDYLVVDSADLPFPLTPARCGAICDRHTGIGSDGILVADLRRGVALRILNPDGSEAEKSGNGLRIFAAYLHGRGLVRDEWFTVRLVRDSVRMKVEGTGPDGALDVRAEMGRATFAGEDTGFAVAGEVVGHTLELPDGGSAEITTVSLANPHCVVFVEKLDRRDFLSRAPQLCTHGSFAHGTNVQFALVAGPSDLEAWIWERGAGETLASGSSACAVAAAAVRRGFVAPGKFEVHMPGGTADVEVNETYAVRLRGPARIVFRCEVAPEQVEDWRRLS